MNRNDIINNPKNPIKGGVGDKLDLSKFDKKTIKNAIKVEMEHTKNVKIALDIVKDHLQEDPLYYSKLKKAKLEEENLLQGLPFMAGTNLPTKEKSDTTQSEKPYKIATFAMLKSPEFTTNPDITGTMGHTADINCGQIQSDVETPASDPTPTNHFTGAITSTPVNNAILPKNKNCKLDTLSNIANSDMVNIAEGKNLLKKMLKECVKTEGYGGDPSTDSKYVKGKRWTLKGFKEGSNLNPEDLTDKESEA